MHVQQAGRFLLRQLEHRDAGPVGQDLSDLFLTDLSDFLKGLRDKYEAHHRVSYTDEALKARRP